MLLVKTKIGPSHIEGLGLFADEFIPAGTVIWKFQPGLDLVFDRKQVDTLPEVARKYFLNHAWLRRYTDQYILDFDNDRYGNHSDNPNCMSVGESENSYGETVAKRDIQIGEEITYSYEEYDGDSDYKLKSL